MSYSIDIPFNLLTAEKAGHFDEAVCYVYSREDPNTPVALNLVVDPVIPVAAYDYRIDEILDPKGIIARCRVWIVLPDDFESGRIDLDFPADDTFVPFGDGLESYINAAKINSLEANMGQFLPVPPPTLCRVTGSLVSGAGDPKSGSTILFQITPAPAEDPSGVLVSNEEVTVYVENDGTFAVNLVAGKLYQVTCDALGLYRKQITVPVESTVTLSELL